MWKLKNCCYHCCAENCFNKMDVVTKEMVVSIVIVTFSNSVVMKVQFAFQMDFAHIELLLIELRKADINLTAVVQCQFYNDDFGEVLDDVLAMISFAGLNSVIEEWKKFANKIGSDTSDLKKVLSRRPSCDCTAMNPRCRIADAMCIWKGQLISLSKKILDGFKIFFFAELVDLM